MVLSSWEPFACLSFGCLQSKINPELMKNFSTPAEPGGGRGAGLSGDLEEDSLACGALVWDPESCGLVLPSPQRHHLIWGSRHVVALLQAGSAACVCWQHPDRKARAPFGTARADQSAGTGVISVKGTHVAGVEELSVFQPGPSARCLSVELLAASVPFLESADNQGFVCESL